MRERKGKRKRKRRMKRRRRIDGWETQEDIHLISKCKLTRQNQS